MTYQKPTRYRNDQGNWHQVDFEEEDMRYLEHMNAIECHLKRQADIPDVIRDAIFEAEFNLRFNEGDIAPIASIDNGEKLLEVPEELERQQLLCFLWANMIEAGGKSIHFAFATVDEGLCVTFLSRDEGYVAQSSLERNEGKVCIGDWRVTEMERKPTSKFSSGGAGSPAKKEKTRRRSARTKIRSIRRRRTQQNCMPRPLKPRHLHLEGQSRVDQAHCTRAKRVPRNKPCPCGSGRKSKNCCKGKTKDRSCKEATPVPQQDGCSGDAHCKDGHQWVVFSTALADGCLMLNCTACGAMGTVDNPSRDEWAPAFEAPSKPYRWMDSSRVRFRQEGPVYVERWSSSPTAGKIIASETPLTERELKELELLEDTASDAELDGQLLDDYVHIFQEVSRIQPTRAIEQLTEQVSGLVSQGRVFTPAMLAIVIREYVRESPKS